MGALDGYEPSSAQCFIKLNDRYQMEAVRCGEGKFGVEQVAFGKEHVHIARNPSLVAQVGHMQS